MWPTPGALWIPSVACAPESVNHHQVNLYYTFPAARVSESISHCQMGYCSQLPTVVSPLSFLLLLKVNRSTPVNQSRRHQSPAVGSYQWKVVTMDEFFITAITQKQMRPWLVMGGNYCSHLSEVYRTSEGHNLLTLILTLEVLGGTTSSHYQNVAQEV